MTSRSFVVLFSVFAALGCEEPLVEGRVTFEGDACFGSPEARAGGVITVTAKGERGTALEATANTEGRYVFERVPADTYVITINDSVDERVLAAFTPPKDAVPDDPACRDQPLPGDRGRLTGTICDRHVGNGALNGVAIVEIGAETVTTRVTDGRFDVDVPAGRGTVVIDEDAPGIYLQTFIVDVPVDGVFDLAIGDNCQLPTADTGCVIGSMCVPTTGGSLAGAGVTVVDAADEATTTVTDINGFFEFCGLAVGTATVTVDVEGGQHSDEAVVVAGGTAVVDPPQGCPREPVCLEFPYAPEEIFDGRVYFIVDRSGSMDNEFADANVRKWDALRTALAGATDGLQNDNIDYALMPYPNVAHTACERPAPNGGFLDCQRGCEEGTERLAMGASQADLVTTLNGIEPFGFTPTASTLRAVADRLDNLDDDGRPLAVVLATDGAPNCATENGLLESDVDPFGDCTAGPNPTHCTDTSGESSDVDCLDALCIDTSAAAAVGALRSRGVIVHVVGIDGGEAEGFTDVLNQMADEGGAPLAGDVRFHNATSAATLESALRAVTRSIAACQIVPNFDVVAGVDVVVDIDGVDVPADVDNGYVVRGPRSIELVGAACTEARDATLITVRGCID
jgi:hypothetical protein